MCEEMEEASKKIMKLKKTSLQEKQRDSIKFIDVFCFGRQEDNKNLTKISNLE